MAAGNLAVDPVMQLATIGMLGVLDPKAALGDLMTPIISIAVAVILFEGGLTLNFHQLRDASQGVKRLVLVEHPLVGSHRPLPCIMSRRSVGRLRRCSAGS